jgi:hypothetical protein
VFVDQPGSVKQFARIQDQMQRPTDQLLRSCPEISSSFSSQKKTTRQLTADAIREGV